LIGPHTALNRALLSKSHDDYQKEKTMPQQLNESFHKVEGKLETAATHAAETLKAMEHKGAERYAASKENLRERWATAKADLGQLRQSAADYSQSAAKTVDTFARNRPWVTAGIAVGVGALIAWLITRD
jgi:ElaB/YqjD/DUF883 family membrane-anchored ribosome-binding protein